MNVNFAPDLHTVNVSIDTPMLSAKFSQIRLNKYIGSAIVEHPQYSKLERVAQQVFQGQLYRKYRTNCIVIFLSLTQIVLIQILK